MSESTKPIYDPNGYPCLNRCEAVVPEIRKRIEKLQDEYYANYQEMVDNGVKNARLKTVNLHIVKCIATQVIQQKIERVPNEVAKYLTADQLMAVSADYLNLIVELNRYCNFVGSKQLFAAFAGITLSSYNMLLESKDQAQKEAMENIESMIVDLLFDSSASGVAKEGAVKSRLSARRQGHQVVNATPLDSIFDPDEEQASEAELRGALENIKQVMLLSKKNNKQ